MSFSFNGTGTQRVREVRFHVGALATKLTQVSIPRNIELEYIASLLFSTRRTLLIASLLHCVSCNARAARSDDLRRLGICEDDRSRLMIHIYFQNVAFQCVHPPPVWESFRSQEPSIAGVALRTACAACATQHRGQIRRRELAGRTVADGLSRRYPALRPVACLRLFMAVFVLVLLSFLLFRPASFVAEATVPPCEHRPRNANHKTRRRSARRFYGRRRKLAAHCARPFPVPGS